MGAAIEPHREVGRQFAPFGRPFRNTNAGFTLLELALIGIVLAVLAAIAVPTYKGHIDRLKVGQAASDLRDIALAIERFRTTNSFSPPDSLAQLTGIPLTDPWGNPYQYLHFGTGPPGKIRKDHNLHPLNSEFDLYSLGADGKSSPPLTAKPSQDDVIWARDGGFVGLASDF
jgi:general secretion pathway protein G